MKLLNVGVVVIHNPVVVLADDEKSDVAALVGGTLKMGEGIHVNKTGGNVTFALTETVGMTGAEHKHHIVDNFLKGLNAAGGALAVGLKRFNHKAKDLLNRGADDFELALCGFGETEAAFVHLESHLVEVGGIVTNTLNIGNALHKEVYLAAVALGIHMVAQLDKEGGGMVGELVKTVLIFLDFVVAFGVVAFKLTEREGNIVSGGLCHSDNGISQNAEGNGGRMHKLFVQSGKFGILVLFSRVILNDGAAEFDKETGKGNENDCGCQIENGLEACDGDRVGNAGPKVGEAAASLYDGHNNHKENSANGVENDMDNAGALCVFAGADGADKGGGDAGTQIDTHDHGVDKVEIHCTGGGESLKNTDHCGGTLDNNGEDKAGEDAEKGHVAEEAENIDEGVGLAERFNGVGHQHKTGEENTKAESYEGCALGGFALDEHKEDNADDKGDRSEVVGLEEGKQSAACLDIHKSDYPGGDGGADVGTHNNADTLTEVQNTCANKTHGEDDGCGGTLNDGGDQQAGKKTGDNIAGELAKEVFEGVTGALLKAVTHDFHTVEEHGKTAEKFNNCQYSCHFCFSILQINYLNLLISKLLHTQ